MSSTAHEPQINRTVVFVSLGLALALVLAVLVGARVFYHRVALQPVAMSELPAPEASSPEYASLIDALPGSLAGLKRAELAEPAPAGAAAWRSSSTERITLRCGVDIPAQYTPYSQTQDVGGAQWLRVDDATPGSDLTTWYAVDRVPGGQVRARGGVVDAQPLRAADVLGLRVRGVLRGDVHAAAQGDALGGRGAPRGGAGGGGLRQLRSLEAGEGARQGVDKRGVLGRGRLGRGELRHGHGLKGHPVVEHARTDQHGEDEREREPEADEDDGAVNLWFVRRGTHGGKV